MFHPLPLRKDSLRGDTSRQRTTLIEPQDVADINGKGIAGLATLAKKARQQDRVNEKRKPPSACLQVNISDAECELKKQRIINLVAAM